MGVTRVKKSKKKREANDDPVEALHTDVEALNIKDTQPTPTTITTTESQLSQSVPSSITSSSSTLSTPLPSSPSSSVNPSPILSQSKFELNSTTTAIDLEHLEQFEPPIEVRITPNKGFAVFATRKIPAGSLVLAERPLIRLTQAEEDTDKSQSGSSESQDDDDDDDDDDDNSPLTIQFQSLPKSTKKAYLKLHDSEKSSFSRIKSIYYSNCYNLSSSPTFPSHSDHHSRVPDKHAADTDTDTDTTASEPRLKGAGGSCIGLSASRLNHSCIPNVQFSFSESHNLMLFHAVKPIPRGREVLSTYDTVFAVRAQRRKSQLMYYGFECDCEACVATSAFWERSDERRRVMVDVKKTVVRCEREWWGTEKEKDKERGLSGDEKKQEKTKREDICVEAYDALITLEGLLFKEGLLGLTLADTCRALSRWADRMGDTDKVRLWRAKELEVCVACFGEQSARVRKLKEELKEDEDAALV